jgi:hypothetical protein
VSTLLDGQTHKCNGPTFPIVYLPSKDPRPNAL